MKKNDLTGRRFGRLVVLHEDSVRCSGQIKWTCKCDCGTVKSILGCHLVSGKTVSCNCRKKEMNKVVHGTHGKSPKGQRRPSVYNSWASMKQRCNNPNCEFYHEYGGRGIKYCESWEKFENFYKDMGDCPSGHSLDRIDPNGNYDPSNCRWASDKEQSLNRRSAFWINLDGEVVPIGKACEILGVGYSTVMRRKNAGWPQWQWFEDTQHDRKRDALGHYLPISTP